MAYSVLHYLLDRGFNVCVRRDNKKVLMRKQMKKIKL